MDDLSKKSLTVCIGGPCVKSVLLLLSVNRFMGMCLLYRTSHLRSV